MKCVELKRLLSSFLAVLMLFGCLPVSAFAADSDVVCEHHTAHVDCGYVEAVEGSACLHEHDELCGYSEGSEEQPCQCQPGEDGNLVHAEGCGYAAAVPASACLHEHDENCGYVPAVEGADCDFVCQVCAESEQDEIVEDSEPVVSPEPTVEIESGIIICFTEWTWVDPDGMLVDGELALPGASAEAVAYFEDIAALLPAAVSTEYGELAVTWSCADYPAEGAYEGTYTFTAILPEGYVPADDAASLTVPVILGGSSQLNILPLTWTYGGGVLTFIGSGYMTEDEVLSFGNSCTEIQFNTTELLNIYKHAFENYSKISEVSIPGSVVEIEEYAFNNSSLSGVGLSANGDLTTIGDYAFAGTKLKSVKLPYNLESLGAGAFANCSELTEIHFLGDAPAFETGGADGVFQNVTATAYYPAGNSTWTSAVMKNYGGGITWKAESTALYSGKCGDNLTWELDANKRLTISGNGAMYNYSSSSPAPWYAYKNDINYIEIKSGVSSIGDYAFYDLQKVYGNIALPESLVTIGGYAFNNCKSFDSISIPGSVKSIGSDAFRGCEELESVYITDIAAWCAIAFENSWANPLFVIPDSGYLYLNDSSVLSLVIPSNVSSISDYAFRGYKLWSVEIAEGVKNIGQEAFDSCQNLKSASIPSTVETIGQSAFAFCPRLGTLTIAEGVSAIGEKAFYSCDALESVVIPSSVNSVGNLAFGFCDALQEISFGHKSTDTVSIGSSAFYTYGSSGNLATTLNVPYVDDINSNISNYSWSGDSRKVTFAGGTKLVEKGLGADGLEWVFDAEGVLSISGTGPMADYTGSDMPWISYKDNIKSVVIGEGISSVGKNAFKQHTALTKLEIPASVNVINGTSFDGCSNLKAVYIKDVAAWCAISFNSASANPLYKGAALYLNGELITDLVIPEGVADVRQYTFVNNTNLKSISFPASLSNVGYGAFYGCTGIDSIYISDLDAWCSADFGKSKGNTSFAANGWNPLCYADTLYLNGQAVTDLVVPSETETIGFSAFRGYTALKTAYIHSGVSSIGEYAFDGCTDLVITYEGSLSQWLDIGGSGRVNCTDGSYLCTGHFGEGFTWYLDDKGILTISGSGAMPNFNSNGSTTPWKKYMADIKTVVIEEGITTVGEYAFYFAKNLSSVSFPDTLTTLGNQAFAGCDSLAAVYIPEKLTNLGSIIFNNCESISSYTVAEGNTVYSSDSNGVLYNKDKTTLLRVPSAMSGEFVVPDSVVTIGGYAFERSSAEKITVPDSVVAVRNGAFSSLQVNAEIILGKKLAEFDNFVFDSKVKSVVFTGDAPKIQSYTFSACKGTVYYPANNTSWTSSVGQNYGGTLTWQPYLEGSYAITVKADDKTARRSEALPQFAASISSEPAVSGLSIEGLEYEIQDNQGNVVTASELKVGEYNIVVKLPENTLVKQGNNRVWYSEPITTVSGKLSVVVGTLASGQCSETISWSVDSEGNLTVSGSGDMPNYTSSSPAPWAEYKDSIKTAVIEDGITGLGNRSFYNHSALETVSLSKDLTSIGNYAFYGCTELDGISLPAGLETLGDDSFSGCTSLTSIDIPDAVTELYYTFYGCTALETVELPANLERINNNVFGKCSSLERISIPASVSYIAYNSFSGCHALAEIQADPLNEKYCVDSFGVLYNKEMTTLMRAPVSLSGTYNIPETVTEIEYYAFEQCKNLKEVILTENITEIGSEVFIGSSIEKITIPYTVTEISYRAFEACSELDEIYFEGSAPAISSSAFKDVTAEAFYPLGNDTWNTDTMLNYGGSLTWGSYESGIEYYTVTIKVDDQEITFGDKLPTLSYSISSQPQLENLTIDSIKLEIRDSEGKTVTANNKLVAGDDYSITAVLNKHPVVKSNGKAVALSGSVKVEEAVLTVNDSDLIAFDSWWKLYDDGKLLIDTYSYQDMPDYTTREAPWYEYAENVRAVEWTNGPRSIGDKTFSDCINLTEVIIPASVSEIGEYAFYGCTLLRNVVFAIDHNSSMTIGARAFSQCASLSSIFIPGRDVEIGDYAFYGCSNLQWAAFCYYSPAIGEYAFYNCTSLKNIYTTSGYDFWLNDYSGIKSTAFYGVTANLCYPVGFDLNSSSQNAVSKLSGNLSWKQVSNGPSSPTAWWSFDANSGKLSITGSGHSAYIYFSGNDTLWTKVNDSILSAEVGEGITYLDPYTFEYARNMKSVSLPNSLKTLNANAFNDCESLNNLIIPASVTAIYNTFNRCKSLTDIYYMGTEEEWKNVAGGQDSVDSTNSLESKAIKVHFLVPADVQEATCTEAGLEPYYVFDDRTVYSGMYNLDKQPIDAISYVPAKGHRVIVDENVSVNPLTVENDSSVPFVQSGNTYTSNNKSHNSYSDIRIIADYACTLVLNYGVSSEKNYDKLIIYDGLNVAKDSISGTVSGKTMTFNLKAGEQVTVRYSKDGSASKNDDHGWVSLSYKNVELGTGETVEVPADRVEASCRGPVVCSYCNITLKEALDHSWDNGLVTISPTCKEDGVRTFSCTVCGKTKTGAEPKHNNHTWNDGVVTTEPTCKENGVRTFTCEVCGDTKTGAEPKHNNHTWNDGVVTAKPTCTAEGEKTYTCTLCGETKTESIPVNGENHSWNKGEVTTEPTCTTEGVKTYTCTLCGDTKTESVPVNGDNHSWNKGEVTTEPTCTAEGVKTYTCTLCGDTKTESVPVNSENHSWNKGEVTTEPTCTAEGVKTYTCGLCGDTKTESVPVNGDNHSWNKGEVTIEPTCSAEGVKTYTCTLCGETKTESVPVNGENHSWNKGEVTTEPSCSAEGVKTYTCTLCGDTKTESVPVNGENHSWNKGEVTTEPTCNAEGVKTYTCGLCGDTKTESVPVNGENHSWNNGEVTIEPTCTTEGVKTYTCGLCGDTKTESVPVNGENHSWNNGEVTIEPTCSAEGVKTYTCTLCGETKTESVPVNGENHSWNKGEVTTEPTCNAEGVKTYTCGLCGDTKTESVPVNRENHSWGYSFDSQSNVVTKKCLYCTDTEGTLTLQIPTDAVYSGEAWRVGFTNETDDEVSISYRGALDNGLPVNAGEYCVLVQLGQWQKEISFSIAKKPLTVTMKSYTINKGDALPDFAWDHEEIIAEQGIKLTPVCDAKDSSMAGEYKIGASVENAANYELTIKEGVLSISAGSLVKLDGAAPGATVYINGAAHTLDQNGMLVLPEAAEAYKCLITSYSYNTSSDDPHSVYPTGLMVWELTYDGYAYSTRRMEQLDNIMQYAGSSIRITGVKGIRMITGVPSDRRDKLMGDGIEGYTLEEYGTIVAWESELGGDDLTLDHEAKKGNYAYKKGVADPIYDRVGGNVQYTNVLVGFSNDQCVPDLVMRSYMVLTDAEGNSHVIYGGPVQRSIGYIAYQNRLIFSPGSASYNYIWDIIHHVYGDKYDADFKK